MNFKKLQAMQAKLDEAILKEKATMTDEERFNKTLVALSVEIAEVANTVEHFKFWKDNKGKVDEGRFELRDELYNWGFEGHGVYADKSTRAFNLVTKEQAHRLTLIEECSDALHFILSLANQCNCDLISYQKRVGCDGGLEEAYLIIQECISDNDSEELFVGVQDIINWFIRYVELLGITHQELEQAYYDKNKVNYERLENGY